MVEKQRGKDLGKVVTGGGEGTEAEGTEKANHRGHGEKQTTENTEDTEKEERGRVEVECGGVRAGWRLELSHRSGLCGSAGVTAGMASLAACSTEKPAWQA